MCFDGNRTHNLLMYGMMLLLIKPLNQGQFYFLISCHITSFFKIRGLGKARAIMCPNVQSVCWPCIIDQLYKNGLNLSKGSDLLSQLQQSHLVACQHSDFQSQGFLHTEADFVSLFLMLESENCFCIQLWHPVWLAS